MSPSYVHLSELMTCALETEKGWLPVQGFHALAGVEITAFPLSNGKMPEREGLEGWRRRMAWFWKAVAFSTFPTGSTWFTGYELRVKATGVRKDGQTGLPLRAGLWAKTVAPNPAQARQTSTALAEMIGTLFPVDFCPKAITTEPQFFDLWGAEAPAWLGEVRPGISAIPKPEGDRASAEGWEVTHGRWHPEGDGMLEPWALLARLEDPTWLSLGICPTHLFETEKTAWPGIHAPDSKTDRANSLRADSPLFQVRVRMGGGETARWLAQACAATLQRETSLNPVILTPATHEEEQNATFNWQWGDFQPWAELPLPGSLRRFRYLMDAGQMGALAGIWV